MGRKYCYLEGTAFEYHVARGESSLQKVVWSLNTSSSSAPAPATPLPPRAQLFQVHFPLPCFYSDIVRLLLLGTVSHTLASLICL